MILILHKNLYKLKEHYEELYKKDKEATPFQSFDFLLSTIKHNYFTRVKYNTKIIIYEVCDGNRPILIMPIEHYRSFCMLVSTLDSLNILYDSEIGDQLLYDAFYLIINNIGKKIKFRNVREKSKLQQILSNDKNIIIDKETECAELDLSKFSTFEEYFSSLSKSARQNIRTYYNRMQKDNIKHLYYNLDKDKTIIKKRTLRNLYLKRFSEKNKNILKTIFTAVYEPIQKVLLEQPNVQCGILQIKDNKEKIAAYFMGLNDKINNSIVIPRLVYNSKYSRYGSGMILIIETIKDMFISSKVRTLDLGTGNEPYKYVLGCEKYMAYNYTLDVKNDTNSKH